MYVQAIYTYKSSLDFICISMLNKFQKGNPWYTELVLLEAILSLNTEHRNTAFSFSIIGNMFGSYTYKLRNSHSAIQS